MIEWDQGSYSRSMGDRIAAVVFPTMAAMVAGVFFWLLFDLIRHGAGQISWDYLTGVPENAGRSGGILPILVSTLLILAICLATAAPLGLGAAIFPAEFSPAKRGFGRLVRRSLDVLAGVPSIVFGLFGNAFFCIYLGMVSLFSQAA